MADTTKLTIELETILRGLDKTLRGLDQIKKRLDSVAGIGTGAKGGSATATTDRAARATERLARQQQVAAVRATELANRQERARQASERLTLSQQRLTDATARAGQQMDAHVQAFRALERSAQQTTKRLEGVGNSLRSVGQGLSTIGLTLSAAVTAPLLAFGAATVDAAVRLDSLKRGLTAIVGSSDEAGRQLARLTQLAKLPGIGFEEAIQGSIRLQAVGFSAKEAERSLREFSNAVALTGGGRDELNRVTVQLGQLAAKGKVLSQDLRPIIESAPAVGRALLQAFGTVNAADIQELGLSSKQFLDILVDELERLPRAAAGAKNSFENFRDELFRAAATVGTALLPALTRLAETVGPIITGLANAFAALPQPLQVIVLGLGGLLAALGPILLVVGQLTTGVGRLIVGFAQLNALGILPTIKNLKALVTGALAGASAQRTLAAATALAAGGLGIIVAVLGVLVTAYAAYSATQKDTITLGKEHADALTDQINGLREQAKFIDGLKDGVASTADEQSRLLEIYSSLNREAKVRITSISDETQRTAALREELQRLIALREQERIQQAGSIAAELANNLQRIQANEQERDSLAGRIQANAALIETLEREQAISNATTRALAQRGITASTVEDAIGALKVESENLSASQDALIVSSKELNDQAKDQVAIVKALERQTGLTARELLVVGKNMGRFRGDVAEILPVLERYVAKTDEATRSTEGFNRALSENARKLNEAGEKADEAAKGRRTLIQSAAAIARETSVDFEGALKSLRQMVDAVPELSRAVKREGELTGKSLDELLRESLESAFKRSKGDTTSLRNAQKQLADALNQITLAQGEREVELEKEKGERLLAALESGQRLRLISYRQYLEQRAQLTTANLDREIGQQLEVVRLAKATQIELLGLAQGARVPEAERVRRRAQAAAAEQEAIKAETKLQVLREKRGRIEEELTQLLRVAQDEQLKDTRQLEIEYAKLQGRIEDSLKAESVEEFRESLERLGKAQDFLNTQLKTATGERREQLELERNQNQRQIESINNQIRAKDALAQLAATEQLVTNAKDRQKRLEDELRFQVQFRGLTEEEAIKRRLEGEAKLRASMELAKSIIEDARQALVDFGTTPPPELGKFIDGLKTELQGLGELSLTEQFRLAEKEFDRLNDQRLQRIADVERAVRNRDIAEAEGLLLIRRINGQYVGDLQRQLNLLKQIATASNDASLQRQAQSAEETVKDTTDELASFNRQLRAGTIDTLQDSLTQFFIDLTDRTKTAKEKLLGFFNSLAGGINKIIAENLSRKLVESLFPRDGGGGIIASVKRLFGFGGDAGKAGAVTDITGAAGKATQGATLQAAATVAATTLTTGATAAATALTTGGASFAASLTAAAASFSAAIIAAGASFAAAVGASSAVQSAGGLGASLGAATGLFPAVPGGAIRVLEGGHPEAILTTDPKHAQRQVAILRQYLTYTRGLFGRIPSFATGGIAVNDALSGLRPPATISANLSGLQIAGAGASTIRLRQVLTDERDEGNWLESSEGERVLRDKLIKNRPLIRNLAGGRS